jgi:hypothetical protein
VVVVGRWPLAISRAYSERKGMRSAGMKVAAAESGSLNGLCPRVKDSQVTPQF